MIKMEVFGGGCPKCKQIEKNSREALSQLQMQGEVMAIKDQVTILQRGVTSTPALAINGAVKCLGRIPETPEIVAWLKALQ